MTQAVGSETAAAGWGVLDGLPGDAMMWILVLSELVAFGLLLGAFTVARAIHPALFGLGQAGLATGIAALNTVVLVTSGWAAARGTLAARSDRRRAARVWLLGAIALGGVFVLLKTIEYAREIAGGVGLESSPFFTLYFLLTGFHLLHVLLGMVILAVVWRRADPFQVETATVFWHMVDLVWIVMFPILYLVH